MRRMVLLHTTAPYAGIPQIVGVLDYDFTDKELPVTVPDAQLLGDRLGVCVLTSTSARYVVYTEQGSLNP